MISSIAAGGFPAFVVQGFEELLFRVVHCWGLLFADYSVGGIVLLELMGLGKVVSSGKDGLQIA